MFAPRFKWTCSYLGCQWYEVQDETGIYSAEVRYETSDYERSITNYTPQEFEHYVVGAIDMMRREHDVTKPIPAATVEAFNTWRASNHAATIARMTAAPARYGAPESWGDLMKAPRPVCGGHYEPGIGLVVDTPLPQAA